MPTQVSGGTIVEGVSYHVSITSWAILQAQTIHGWTKEIQIISGFMPFQTNKCSQRVDCGRIVII